MTLVDLGKRLLESAKLGDTEEVKLLMTSGAPFTTDWLGISPLHMAAQYGHLETAEILLRAGISRDARTKVDRTPLHIAAQEGHLHIVELLIKHGAEIDAKDMLKMTPLHWAVERGHISVISSLLKNSADVFSLNKFDKTAFDIAEDNHRTDLVRILEKYTSSLTKSKDIISKGESAQLFQSSVTQNLTAKLSVSPKIKTESISFAHLKNVNRTATTNCSIALQSTNIVSTTDAASVKCSSSRPILLQANLAHIQKAAAAVAASSSTKPTSSDSEEGDSSDQSCTNVLATLAALAEATAPNASISTSEAVQWLEAHGIAMLPTDNSTVVASALEEGQTVALTEAGKLALTWVKEQQGLSSNPPETTAIQNSSGNNSSSNFQNSPNQKVITIVADKAQLSSVISQQTPIVVCSSTSLQSSEDVESRNDPPIKKMKNLVQKKSQVKTPANGKVEDTVSSAEEERSKLQKELEKIKKVAAEYKAQLLQKEFEAEQYRRQLELMRSLSRNNQ